MGDRAGTKIMTLITGVSPVAHPTSGGVGRGVVRRIGVLGSGAALLSLLAGGLSGCGAKSFMDPTVTGRWGQTPTVMPILDRIASIEDDTGDLIESSDPVAEDLIPRPASYRIGAGDILQVTVFDLIEPNVREEYEVQVDPRGMIELPQLGRVRVQELTTEEAVTEIVAVIKSRNLVQDPLVQVLAVSQRRQTFTIIGAVQNPGLFPIPRADYRILEAVSAAGAFDESIREIYIIRQVPLTDDVTGGLPLPAGAGEGEGSRPADPATPAEGADFLDLIDTIAPEQRQGEPAQPAQPAPSEPQGSPGALSSTRLARAASGAALAQMDGEANGNGEQRPAGEEPIIDLIEPETPGEGAAAEDGYTWIFVNGRWVKVKSATVQEAQAAGVSAEDLITQRVIRVPLAPLLAGRQSVNVIIRPGDVLRFPSAASGFVHMGGQVARPGPYQMIPGMTLTQAITSAGGLTEIGIPWRVDLTRMVGQDRQATIRLDLRAIAERTQPNIYMKPGDEINVGTNFWALPLAVTRNGFRVSYGFGFILDRNLSNDIFGPPPVNSIGQ